MLDVFRPTLRRYSLNSDLALVQALQRVQKRRLSVTVDVAASENLLTEMDFGDARNLFIFFGERNVELGRRWIDLGVALEPLIDLLFAEAEEF